MHLLTKIQAIVQSGPYGNYLFQEDESVGPLEWLANKVLGGAQAYNTQAETLNPQLAEDPAPPPPSDFDPLDPLGLNVQYSAEELATADPAEMISILDSFDIGSDMTRYFAQFDPQKIADIEANLENKMDQLGVQYESKVENLKQQIGDARAGVGTAATKTAQKGAEAGAGYRAGVAQRGFEAGGDLQSRFKQQKEGLFGDFKTGVGAATSAIKTAERDVSASGQLYGLRQEEFKLGADIEKRSAYEDYMDRFYSMLGTVTAMEDDED